MKTLTTMLAIVALSGCARFSTTQKDIRDGTTTTITTHASSWTFFDSKSALAKWNAAQTEAKQGAEVGGLSQQSDGTNAVNLIQAVSAGATKGALEFMVKKP